MKIFKWPAAHRGATRLRFVDVLTALILLAILLYASWLQFPSYHTQSRSAATAHERPAPPASR